MNFRGRKCHDYGEIMRSFIIFTRHQILLHRPIKEDEISGACNMHEGDKKLVTKKIV
jgi:hypothetical protein